MKVAYDGVIIGGGIVGLAVARELKKRIGKSLRLCLVEKEPQLGRIMFIKGRLFVPSPSLPSTFA
jgi:L-2-hydroxyglutarate oxidase LhgO